MFLCILYLISRLFGVQFLTVDLIVSAGGEYVAVSGIIFRAFIMKSCKNKPINFTMPVWPSTCNSSKAIEHISMELGTGYVYQNMSQYIPILVRIGQK